MGAFDNYDDCEKFSEHFNEGDILRVQKLEVGPELNTDFGPGQTFVITVNGQRYMGFGAGIVNQARRQEQGDFPATVQFVTKAIGKGRSPMKQFIPASDVAVPATGVIAAPHATASDPKPADHDDIPF